MTNRVPSVWPSWQTLLLLGLILSFLAGVRYRLIGTALERDEGEYAYAGQLLLQGEPPFRTLYTMKFPGMTLCGAVCIALFGETGEALHFGLLLIHAGSTVLLFLLVRRMHEQTNYADSSGLVAAAAFAYLALVRRSLGFTANAEHFLLFLVLLACWLLSFRHRVATVLSAGLCLGMAILVKQPAAWFAPLLLVLIFSNRSASWLNRCTSALVFLLAVAGVVATLFVSMYFAGVFDTFWQWTMVYGPVYASSVPFQVGWERFQERFGAELARNASMYLFIMLGLAAAAWRPVCLGSGAIYAGFALTGVLAVTYGFHMRSHYFLLLAPATAMLLAWSWVQLRNCVDLYMPSSWPILLAALLTALLLPPLSEYHYLFFQAPDDLVRRTYGRNPFLESRTIAAEIQAESSPEDRVFVYGSEPQICFYSRRRSATAFIYMYPLTEGRSFSEEMQRQMMTEVDDIDPRYVVYVHIPQSWAEFTSPPFHDHLLHHWIDEKLKDYELLGMFTLAEGYPAVRVPNTELQTAYRENQELGARWIAWFRRKG